MPTWLPKVSQPLLILALAVLSTCVSCGYRLTAPPQEVTDNRKLIATNVAAMGEALEVTSNLMVASTPEAAAAKEKYKQKIARILEETVESLEVDERYFQSSILFSSEESVTQFTDLVSGIVARLRGEPAGGG